MLYQEWITYLMAILIIGVALFFTSKGIAGANTNINDMSPEITYQFPAVFVHTFLNYRIEKADAKELDLDPSKEYYVKDLIILDTQKTNEMVDEYKQRYINDMNTLSGLSKKPSEYFEKFSEKEINENSLLTIHRDRDELPDLELQLRNKNYFFYLKTLNNKYTLVFFKI